MDSRICVESELNKGSKFSFTAHFGLEARVISASAHVLLSLADYRILVVDDNQINRLIVREMVTSCGAEVSEAVSGEEALAAIREGVNAGRPYRIVLLDMRMPGMDGLEVAQLIQREHLPIRPLILMLSSDDLKPQVARLREIGLDAYLVKPITRRELFEAIRRVIEEANLNSADTLPERRAPQIQSATSAGAPQMRILVAEDSPDNRLVIAAYLRREPYHVDFAQNGREAGQQVHIAALRPGFHGYPDAGGRRPCRNAHDPPMGERPRPQSHTDNRAYRVGAGRGCEACLGVGVQLARE
jgi:CheY-like chemotaxis protein